MEAEPNKPAESPQRSAIGPGERLQAARIEKGLSVEDVANRMHLSTSILQSIEENNFDEITAPIFVKGYLRAYARIVTLSEDEMIEQYIELYSEEDPPISSTSNMVPELSSTDTRIKWTTYFVIVVLAVLLAAWWWNKQQNPQPTVSLDGQSSAIAENDANEGLVDSGIEAGSEMSTLPAIGAAQGPDDSAMAAAEAEPQPEPDSPLAMESVETEASTARSGSEDDTNGTAAEQVEIEDSAAPEPSVASLESEGDMPAISDSAVDSVVEGTQTETPVVLAGTRQQPSKSAPTGSDKLSIVVHADTWADVKDSNNYQLLYDLLRADSSVELSGQAPFTVFLGNGHGVEILFNGEEIGFSSRVRDDNTARLNVGG